MKSIVLIRVLCLSLLFLTGCAQKGSANDAARVDQTSTPDAVSNEITKDGDRESVSGNGMHVRTSNTVGDVVNHPAFEGFGQFILPLDRGRYDNNMPLANVASLLPYHSNVDPDAAVATINDMIDQAASGKTIFYDIYTDRQKQSDPTKESTGLFFFRGKPGAPVAVISPGGGFSYVGSVHEGFPHAIALSQKGYNAFVLQYRVRRCKAPASMWNSTSIGMLVTALEWVVGQLPRAGSKMPFGFGNITCLYLQVLVLSVVDHSRQPRDQGAVHQQALLLFGHHLRP